MTRGQPEVLRVDGSNTVGGVGDSGGEGGEGGVGAAGPPGAPVLPASAIALPRFGTLFRTTGFEAMV